MNIKEKITPSNYNEKLGRYQNLSNDELENLKSSYARYYNSKVNNIIEIIVSKFNNYRITTSNDFNNSI